MTARLANPSNQKKLYDSIVYSKEVERMKQHSPVIHCIYADIDQNIPELIEESFRLYLVRILAETDKPVVQCLR